MVALIFLRIYRGKRFCGKPNIFWCILGMLDALWAWTQVETNKQDWWSVSQEINNNIINIFSFLFFMLSLNCNQLISHSRFGHYFCSNLYGRAPRGVKKSDFFFYKLNCWVFALELPQKGTNFEKSSKLKKNVKKTLFS